MDWIMSEGGPLICLERTLKESWGGIYNLSVECPNAATDYDRACQSSEYTSNIPLAAGSALVLGAGPLDTAIWHSASGLPFLVSVFSSEVDVDEERLLADMPESIFTNPIKSTEIRFGSPQLILFDSAEPGAAAQNKTISFNIDPTNYNIITQQYDPNDAISFLIHKFQKVI